MRERERERREGNRGIEGECGGGGMRERMVQRESGE